MVFIWLADWGWASDQPCEAGRRSLVRWSEDARRSLLRAHRSGEKAASKDDLFNPVKEEDVFGFETVKYTDLKTGYVSPLDLQSVVYLSYLEPCRVLKIAHFVI